MKKTICRRSIGFFLLLTAILFVGTSAVQKDQTGFDLKYETYQLANGLTVILHTDKSDPMVAIAIQYHVGSNREVQGKTGYAHLFEHIMFQRSENVAEDQFFKKVQNAGGDLNGGTGNDGTVYYEVVPKNALELVLWLESDRMGYLLNTITPASFANQQNVVQNEKRQRMDNTPYGFNNYVIDKNLFPAGHPYSWEVIGEMKDLENATIDDVKSFYLKYYVPNNATLAIAGDIDPSQVKQLVEKYFGEIPAENKVTDLPKMDITLSQTKRLYHEDNFADAPRLTMVWPTIHEYSPDSYALDFLGELLASGKKSPMYKVIIEEKRLAPKVMASNNSMELAGKFSVSVTANTGTNLNDVEAAINESFARFEKEGISDADLERIKAKMETDFYEGISSVLNKAFQLAHYNEYAGDPGYIKKDLASIMAVTKEDIWRVYHTYIQGKPYIMTSFVPKGHADLAAKGSVPAGIVEENINEATEAKEVSQNTEQDSIRKTPTKIDRSKEPPLGPDPVVVFPKIWESEMSNGIKVSGIEQQELPLVRFSLLLKGGHLLDDLGKPGVANLLAYMMKSGTVKRNAVELEEAIDMLGSTINVFSTSEATIFDVSCLDRNYEKTLDLVREMILEPRWDEKEFAVAKTRTLNALIQQKSKPSYQAGIAFKQLVFGKNNIFYYPVSGTEESVKAITLDDVKALYNRSFSPSVASFQIAGSVPERRVLSSLKQLEKSWAAKEVNIPVYQAPVMPEKSAVYFIDVPGAKQSVIYIGYAALKRNDPDFYPATVMNYRLGGNFNSMLNMILREDKGYTYGASSDFSGMKTTGYFIASSSVRSNATEESVRIFKETMANYAKAVNNEDLTFTRNSILRSNALNFETLESLLGVLQEIDMYNLPENYIQKEMDVVQHITLDQMDQLAGKYIHPERMIYIVVGDAQSQMSKLDSLGLGPVVKYSL